MDPKFVEVVTSLGKTIVNIPQISRIIIADDGRAEIKMMNGEEIVIGKDAWTALYESLDL